jgi:hypothetical protein
MSSLTICLYVTKKEIRKAIKESYFTIVTTVQPIIVNLELPEEEERLESDKADIASLLNKY